MCFSAEASFIAGAGLSTAGFISLKRAPESAYRAFAAIPLFFGLHQFIEGFLWLTFQIEQMAPFRSIFTYGFIFIAQIFWPSWVPWSFYKLASEDVERKRLKFFVAAGLLTSFSLSWSLVQNVPVATAHTHHIAYELSRPYTWFWKTITALYLITTIIPPFLSKRSGMKTLGTAIGLSVVFAFLLYHAWFLSVWCFFAAIISAGIVYLSPRLNTPG